MPSKFLEVILCFERQYPNQNSVIRPKSNILAPTSFGADYWFLVPLSRGVNARFDLRANPANRFGGAISVIFVSQVSLPVALLEV